MRIIERFNLNTVVEPNTGCILWTGPSDKNGYGKIYANKKHLRAHRLSYEMFKGGLKSEDLVCHKCDTPACVNSEHLFVGTPKDNMIDKVNKGRLKNQWSNRTTCKRGHLFTEENSVYKISNSGNRVKSCKICYVFNYKKRNNLAKLKNKLSKMSKYKASDVLGFRTSKDTL